MAIVTKIYRRINCFAVAIPVFFLCNFCKLAAQDSVYKRPEVTKDWRSYRKQVKDDPGKEMVELKSVVPGLVNDLRYATANNFVHRAMYPQKTSYTFLRRPVAESLAIIQKELNEKGLGLKIFDAYRPYSVTVHFWDLVKDERYVANPARGSGHNRGIAVDLTLVSVFTGHEMDMGTGFDNFSDSAHHNSKSIPSNIQANRKILRDAMERNGFKAFETEWWHYYFADGAKYELLDIDFKKLKR